MLLRYKKFLILLGLESNAEFNVKSTIAFKSGSTLPFCNRAFCSTSTTTADLDLLKKFYNKNPFSIWTCEDNLKKDLEDAGFYCHITWPAMTLDFKNLKPVETNNQFLVQQIFDQQEIIDVWAPLVANIYMSEHFENKDEELAEYIEEFKKFINYLYSTATTGSLNFFIGYFDNQPVATGLFILHKEIVGIHWIGTLHSFRNKGLGAAITNLPLLALHKKQGLRKAMLFASKMGQPIYEKIGFHVMGNISVYKEKT